MTTGRGVETQKVLTKEPMPCRHYAITHVALSCGVGGSGEFLRCVRKVEHSIVGYSSKGGAVGGGGAVDGGSIT